MNKALLFFAFLSQTILISAQNGPKGLQINDKAPLFISKDQNGKEISLNNELKKGSVVLVFYRGQWCPYCNKQLKQMEDSLWLIKAKGATVLTITPEKTDNINKTIAKTKASFPILHDENLQIMKLYDVSFTVENKTIDSYKKYGIDFNEVNGENGPNLPVPAVYIINSAGKIVYSFFDVDYKKRASIKNILEHL